MDQSPHFDGFDFLMNLHKYYQVFIEWNNPKTKKEKKKKKKNECESQSSAPTNLLHVLVNGNF